MWISQIVEKIIGLEQKQHLVQIMIKKELLSMFLFIRLLIGKVCMITNIIHI